MRGLRAEKGGREGFSLVEIMVVVLIIGTLTGGITMAASGYRRAEERKEKVKAEMEAFEIAKGIWAYRFYHPGSNPSMKDLMKDNLLLGDGRSPWGTEYVIRYDKGQVAVFTKDIRGNELRCL